MPNKTEHYQLNQYQPEDDFLRTDFNEDNAKIDEAILAATPVFGTYEGTGDGVAKVIQLGFRPRAVLILPYTYTFTSEKAPLVSLFLSNESRYEFTMLDNGFQVNGILCAKNDLYGTSYLINPYRYIAWR